MRDPPAHAYGTDAPLQLLRPGRHDDRYHRHRSSLLSLYHAPCTLGLRKSKTTGAHHQHHRPFL